MERLAQAKSSYRKLRRLHTSPGIILIRLYWVGHVRKTGIGCLFSSVWGVCRLKRVVDAGDPRPAKRQRLVSGLIVYKHPSDAVEWKYFHLDLQLRLPHGRTTKP